MIKNENPRQFLAAFRAGNDTAQIAAACRVPESAVYNAIHATREAERGNTVPKQARSLVKFAGQEKR